MSPKIILITIIGALVLIIGTAFAFSAANSDPTSTVSYTSTDTDRPRAQTGETLFDWGDMKVSEIRSQDFTLTNTGAKPLEILGVSSSCGCTAVQIIYQNQTSREYSMHNKPEYVTAIAPGDTAAVRLTYRPATMPVFGLVEREVYVTTNDPQNQKLIFKIKVKVS